jgi:hypothetical protein
VLLIAAVATVLAVTRPAVRTGRVAGSSVPTGLRVPAEWPADGCAAIGGLTSGDAEVPAPYGPLRRGEAHR